MNSADVSRRSFVASGAGLAAAGVALSQEAGGAITAGDVIARIKQNVGVSWRESTVDNIIAGDASVPVKGIATVMMATLDVLRAAVVDGLNMVITHESTFFSHQDDVSQITDDPTYQYKLNYTREHNMVVFHFHDHWHALRPTDGIAIGMARELGWDKNADTTGRARLALNREGYVDNPRRFELQPVPLRDLAQHITSRLNASTVRVVGDPDMPVSNIVASWGYTMVEPGMRVLARPDVDVLLVGETREWELVEYAQDIISSGKKKALIVIGHIASEQAGMKLCAEWLKGFVAEVPVKYLVTPEPFWSPGS